MLPSSFAGCSNVQFTVQFVWFNSIQGDDDDDDDDDFTIHISISEKFDFV